MRFGTVRPQPEDLLITSDRFLEVLLGRQGVAEVVVSFRAIGSES